MPEIKLELGKLMAQVETLQKQLGDIKKEICISKTQITDVHTELLNFMNTVQSKNTCQQIHEKLSKDYMLRSEIAPLKSIAGIISLTTISALCLAFIQLILK